MYKLKLQPGDHVALAGLTEQQYHDVAKRFIADGCGAGEYAMNIPYISGRGQSAFGWANKANKKAYNDSLFHGGLGKGSAFGGSLYTYEEIMEQETPSSWFDKGELPPVGTECEVANCENELLAWLNTQVTVISHQKVGANVIPIVWSEKKEEATSILPCLLRPLKSERDRFVDAALKAWDTNLEKYDGAVIGGFKNFAGIMHDAGFRLPEGK